MVTVIYLAMFLCVAGVAVALLPQPQVDFPRLTEGQLPPSRPLEAPLMGARRGFLRALLSLVGRLVPWIRKREERRGQLVDTASNLTTEEFEGIKVLAAGGGALLAMVILQELREVTPLWVMAAAVLGFVMPDAWLRARLARRHKAMMRLLPEIIDILALCVGAGLDFLGALNKVVAVKDWKREPLSEELAAVLQDIKLGKRRGEALRAMAKRVKMPEMTSFVRTLIQADRMGTPIGEALAIHAEDLRFQRFTKAERLALKAPIKILIPLIFCILPSVALIVGAPIFMQFVQQNPFGR
ncbi:MAG: type II secretion system F family protein [Candidatus Omnitrophica bacterium]|nr:type II secretion system F family protein [Candidatus Omnitrophota bacterium]